MCDVIPEDTRLAWTEPILLPFLLFINKVPMLLFHCKVANRNNNSIKTSVSITVRISAGSNLSPEPLENVHQRNTSSHPPTFSLALKESHIPWISSPQFRDFYRRVTGILDSSSESLDPVILSSHQRQCTSECWDWGSLVFILHTSDLLFTAVSWAGWELCIQPLPGHTSFGHRARVLCST